MKSFVSTPAIVASPRTVGWRAALVIAIGAALLVVTALGPMAAELGSASILVWGAAALIGMAQCVLLADLAKRYPNQTGGTATYAHLAFADRPLLAAASGWCYWFAWTPGIAVNALLAAQYLRAALLPWANVYLLAALLVFALYALNARGLRLGIRSSLVLAVCALVPLLAILLAPLVRPDLFEAARVLPMTPTDGWDAGLLLKWLFVAAWSAYGAEMASTIVAEVRDPERHAPRGIVLAGLICVVAYIGVPLALIGIVGVDGITQDPAVALLPAATALFGPKGAVLVTLLLVAALLLGAHAFIIGSSRTLLQMARDGLMIRQCGRLNTHGVPVGSMLFDLVVVLVLLAVFQARLIEIVAAANIGYMVVFVGLPLAWLRLAGARSSRWRVGLAWALFGINTLVLIFGGVQWGALVVGVGVAGALGFLPLLWWRRRQDRRAEVA